MSGLINSISFQENTVSWVQAEVDGIQSINVRRVVESPLPFVINFDNVQNGSTAVKIGSHLRSLADSHEFDLSRVRFLLSARFGFVKKVAVDDTINHELYGDLIRQDLHQTMASDPTDFYIYQPEYFRETDTLREILTVAIRRDLFRFFQRIGEEAGMVIEAVNLNCFSLDELYRRFFPNLMGETVLMSFTERGFEYVLSDERNFVNTGIRPYSKTLQSLDQLDDKMIYSSFNALLDAIQQPDNVDHPAYNISQVFLFGGAFKSSWFDTLQTRSPLPLRILNPLEISDWQINSEDPNFQSLGAYRFIEPLSNIF